MTAEEKASKKPGSQSMRTFYIIWFGQLISTLGSGLTGFALSVYVYEQTRSTTAFAITILMFTLPGVFFSPIAGALVDRFPRRWMMILSDSGAGLTTLAVLLLILGGRLEIWHIYVITFFASLFNTFQWPAQSAATTMLVPQEQLGRAGGMVQIGDAISQLIAPGVAGALFVTSGMQSIILIDFITFIFAVGTLLIVRIPEPVRSAEEQAARRSIMRNIRFGLDYIRQRPGLFYLLMYFAAINFFFSMVNPLFVPMILELGTPADAGLVGSVIGAGMLVGTLVMSAWGGPKRRVYGVLGSGIWMSATLILMGAQPSVNLIAIVGFVMMLALPIMGASSQALWQSKTDPDVQGRVFSVRRMLAQFTVPIAILLSGPLTDRVFRPLMEVGGALENTFIGQTIGVGPGRGVALFFVVVGILQILATFVALSNRRLRRVDLEIPNVEIKAQEEPSLEAIAGS